ncbi:antitoxin Xre/MbcA/ParS toxin-binding domain-containing protein [Burkholderia pseudomallei]|uniref:antitoxin Xre/MbcA/ParS toxin-binding domain-containing protein n=1 Tax=Burkholderia pseudomallei TaxID=28450 RepID=UPI000B0DE048|nr:antitoxin Xre/MbcA/ParS toxin-binding domain-containing protein [Burkholderia pseudomallei]
MSIQQPGRRNTVKCTVSTKHKAANVSIETMGLGARPKDFDAFRKMAPLEQRHQIREGMAAMIVSRIAQKMLHIPLQTLLIGLGWSSSTILRKIAQRQRLSGIESDRIARVLYTFDRAVDVFEDEALAAEWMLRPNIELAGLRPLEVLDSQPGYDCVRDLLTRITFGLSV